jgi:hypothetical protein
VVWIAIALLYLLGMGLFRWLGGIPAAGEALTQWGRSAAERRACRVSSRC